MLYKLKTYIISSSYVSIIGYDNNVRYICIYLDFLCNTLRKRISFPRLHK